MPLYKATVGYSYFGQVMANILWYRDTGNLIGLDGVAAQQGLADAIKNDVVLGGVVGQTRLGDILPNEVRFDEVRVQRVDPVTFLPITNAPAVSNIGLNGLFGDDAGSPGLVAIMNLRCPVTTLAPTDYTPSSGYLAIGPIPESAVENTGNLTSTYAGYLDNFGAAVKAVLDIGGGFTATPIRAGRGKNGLGNLTNGFADILSTSIRQKVSFRRSRNN